MDWDSEDKKALEMGVYEFDPYDGGKDLWKAIIGMIGVSTLGLVALLAYLLH